MKELTVGDIRPLLTLAVNSPILNDSEGIASQLRGILAGLGVPVTAELEASLSLIEANPVLVSAGVAELRSAIENLPEELKMAVTLREIDGMSYEEIAEVMDCPIGTVRSRIFRAREAIDKKMQPLLSASA